MHMQHHEYTKQNTPCEHGTVWEPRVSYSSHETQKLIKASHTNTHRCECIFHSIIHLILAFCLLVFLCWVSLCFPVQFLYSTTCSYVSRQWNVREYILVQRVWVFVGESFCMLMHNFLVVLFWFWKKGWIWMKWMMRFDTIMYLNICIGFLLFERSDHSKCSFKLLVALCHTSKFGKLQYFGP